MNGFQEPTMRDQFSVVITSLFSGTKPLAILLSFILGLVVAHFVLKTVSVLVKILIALSLAVAVALYFVLNYSSSIRY